MIFVSPQVNHWIKDLLHGQSQTVVADGYSSAPCAVTSGVPQGSVICCILFLVYINELPDSVLSQTRLFAEYTVIYNLSCNRE